MSFEDSHMEKVSNDPREEAVVIFDRGVMDNLAYMTPESRDYFRKHCGMDMDQLRDTRYDMVIHMVTAADGAEKFYTLENNRARSESPARAKEIDMLIRQQWAGHKKMMYIEFTQSGGQRE